MQEIIVAIIILLALIWAIKRIVHAFKRFSGKEATNCGCSSCLMTEECNKKQVKITLKKEKQEKK